MESFLLPRWYASQSAVSDSLYDLSESIVSSPPASREMTRLFIGILSLSVFFSFAASTSSNGGVFVTSRYSDEELNSAFAAGLNAAFSLPLSLYNKIVASPRQGSILQ